MPADPAFPSTSATSAALDPTRTLEERIASVQQGLGDIALLSRVRDLNEARTAFLLAFTRKLQDEARAVGMEEAAQLLRRSSDRIAEATTMVIGEAADEIRAAARRGPVEPEKCR